MWVFQYAGPTAVSYTHLNLDADSIYEVPLMLEREGLDDIVIKRLGLKCKGHDLAEWRSMIDVYKRQGYHRLLKE